MLTNCFLCYSLVLSGQMKSIVIACTLKKGDKTRHLRLFSLKTTYIQFSDAYI